MNSIIIKKQTFFSILWRASVFHPELIDVTVQKR